MNRLGSGALIAIFGGSLSIKAFMSRLGSGKPMWEQRHAHLRRDAADSMRRVALREGPRRFNATGAKPHGLWQGARAMAECM